MRHDTLRKVLVFFCLSTFGIACRSKPDTDSVTIRPPKQGGGPDGCPIPEPTWTRVQTGFDQEQTSELLLELKATAEKQVEAIKLGGDAAVGFTTAFSDIIRARADKEFVISEEVTAKAVALRELQCAIYWGSITPGAAEPLILDLIRGMGGLSISASDNNDLPARFQQRVPNGREVASFPPLSFDEFDIKSDTRDWDLTNLRSVPAAMADNPCSPAEYTRTTTIVANKDIDRAVFKFSTDGAGLYISCREYGSDVSFVAERKTHTNEVSYKYRSIVTLPHDLHPGDELEVVHEVVDWNGFSYPSDEKEDYITMATAANTEHAKLRVRFAEGSMPRVIWATLYSKSGDTYSPPAPYDGTPSKDMAKRIAILDVPHPEKDHYYTLNWLWP